jgi:hypothetical protein
MNTDIVDQANQIIVQGAEMVKRLRETLEEEQAERERLERVVGDLADALREVNKTLVRFGSTGTASYVREALDRHGLLRPQDRPEMLPDAWKHTDDDPEAEPTFYEREWFGSPCPACGASASEKCAPDCEDRR